tara:strand:- start:15 stop:530 length:516 start_codon:yes stop_codon:yes gene_type:complete
MNLSGQQRVYVQTQIEIGDTLPLSNEDIQKCIDFSLQASMQESLLPFAVNLRIVGYDEILILNKHYKKENLPTNVLAFEGNLEEEKSLGIQPPFLGDVVICFPVVEKEAMEQKKTFDQHFAHMLVHGFLHLLGFDHQNDKDQKIMQELENEALTNFMFQKMDQPYNSFELK